jgi:hypothetical protein
MRHLIASYVKLAYVWTVTRIDSLIDKIVRELSESRSILCWLYCVFYMWLVVFCVKSNPLSMNTAIMTTGTIVGTIFGAYVISSSYEKVATMRMNGLPDPSSSQVNEAGASD